MPLAVILMNNSSTGCNVFYQRLFVNARRQAGDFHRAAAAFSKRPSFPQAGPVHSPPRPPTPLLTPSSPAARHGQRRPGRRGRRRAPAAPRRRRLPPLPHPGAQAAPGRAHHGSRAPRAAAPPRRAAARGPRAAAPRGAPPHRPAHAARLAPSAAAAAASCSSSSLAVAVGEAAAVPAGVRRAEDAQCGSLRWTGQRREGEEPSVRRPQQWRRSLWFSEAQGGGGSQGKEGVGRRREKGRGCR
jgi:hypothetical protein